MMAAWRKKLEAALACSDKSLSTYFALATLRHDGKPGPHIHQEQALLLSSSTYDLALNQDGGAANRMVGFRKFLPGTSDKLTIVTDLRWLVRHPLTPAIILR